MPESREQDKERKGGAMKPWHKRRLIFILALSVFLHFWFLWSIPRIYSDECLQARILQEFLGGHMRVGAISWTGFSAFHPYPLLYYLLAAPLALVFGGVLAGRILTAAAGVATTYVVFASGRRLKDVRAGLWAAFFFTMMPFQTLFSRWGFVHGLAMFFVALAFHGCLVWREERTWRAAALAGLWAGLAVVTAYWTAPVVLLVFLLLVGTRARDAFRALGLAFVPLAVLLVVMVALHGYRAVAYDIGSLGRIFRGEMTGAPDEGVLGKIAGGYWVLLGIGPFAIEGVREAWRGFVGFLLFRAYHLAGFLGMILALRGWQRRWLLAAFLLLSLLVVGTRGGRIGIFYYPALLFLPFLMLGLGALASAAVGGMEDLCARQDRAPGFYVALVTLPFLLFVVPSAEKQYGLLSGAFDVSSSLGEWYSVRSTEDLAAVADFVNARVGPDDLVVTTPLVGWRLRCRVAEAQQVVAYAGKRSDQYPHDIPHDRFVTALDLSNVTYLVADYYFRLHTMTLLNVFPLVLEIEESRWGLVYAKGGYWVYAGPRARAGDEALEADPMIVGNPKYYAMAADDRQRRRDWKGCLWAYRRATRAMEGLVAMGKRVTDEEMDTFAKYYAAIIRLEKFLGNAEAAADADRRYKEIADQWREFRVKDEGQ
ncbi:MAG: glycosyltransferase family 39 protein [Planctomycetota bacterium]